MPAMTNPVPESQPTSRPGSTPPVRPILNKLLFFIGLVAVAGGIYYYWQSSRQEQAQQTVAVMGTRTAPVKRGDLELRMRLTGQTSARDFANVVAPQLRGPESGPMILLKVVDSGSMVKKGDVIAEFDPQQMKDHLDDTADGLRDRENEVKKKKVNNDLQMENLQQTLRQAKANVDKARLDFKATEIRTEIDREMLKLALEEAEAAYKELQTDVPLTRESQRADLRISEIAKIVEDQHVERHEGDMKRLLVTAPMEFAATA